MRMRISASTESVLKSVYEEALEQIRADIQYERDSYAKVSVGNWTKVEAFEKCLKIVDEAIADKDSMLARLSM